MKTKQPIPEAVYPCSSEFCRAEECCYQAKELYWCATESRWVCNNCWDEFEERLERGVTLEQYLATQKLTNHEIALISYALREIGNRRLEQSIEQNSPDLKIEARLHYTLADRIKTQRLTP